MKTKTNLEKYKRLLKIMDDLTEITLSVVTSKELSEDIKKSNKALKEEARKLEKKLIEPSMKLERGMDWEEPDWEWMNDLKRGR